MSLFLFIVLAFSASAQAMVLNIDEAVEQAQENNPTIEAKILILQRAKMNIGVAQSVFWPKLSVYYSGTRLKNYGNGRSTNVEDMSSITHSGGVRANLSLFAGFTHLNGLQKSFLEADMEAANLQQARLELGVNVKLQFIELLRLREDLKTALESVARIEKQLQAAQAFVKVEMAPYLNVLQNEVELSKAKQQLIRVRNNIRNTEIFLNKYLGYEPSERIEYLGSLKSFRNEIGFTEDEAIKTALFSRPDLVMAQKSIAVAFKNVSIAKGGFLPQVDLSFTNVRMRRDYDSNLYNDYTRTYWSVGLNAQWEFFGGGNSVYGTLAEKRYAESLQKSYEDSISAARAEIISSLLDIESCRELIIATAAGEKAAKESYNMANKRYLTNTGTITDLLDAQLRLTEAESETNRALAEFHSARAKFFFYIGQEAIMLN